MSSLKYVLIVGAGGKLGPHVLRAIDADPRFKVSVLSRTSSSSHFPSHIEVQKIGDEYPLAELVQAFKGKDVVISTIATANAEVQKRLIDASVRAHVKRFIPSEFGCDVRNKKGYDIIPQYFKGKVDTVEYLKGKESDGLTWTTFVTGSFFELAIKVGYMGFDLKGRKATYINDGLGEWSTTTFPTVGLAIKNALVNAEETANKIVYIQSFAVSQRQVKKSLEKVTDGPWEVDHVDGEQRKELGLEKMANGDFTGAPLLLSYINAVEGHGADYSTYQPLSNSLLNLPKENLDEVIAEIVNGTR